MVIAALLPSRAVVRVSGPDAAPFLQGLLTQDLPAPGAARFAALLTPQGKILFDFLVVENEGAYLFDVAAEAADALLKRLTMYRLRAKATIERLDGWSAAALFDDGAAPAGADILAFADPRLASLGRRLIGPREALAEALPDAKDERAFDARRIALGVPEFGKDFAGDEVFLLDVNYDALNGVSYKKGCFVGQEVTSRMKRKGEIRKRTLQLAFEGPAPEKGAAVMAGETTIGEVLSGVDAAALAIIRMDRLAAARQAGAALTVNGRAASVTTPAYLEGLKD